MRTEEKTDMYIQYCIVFLAKFLYILNALELIRLDCFHTYIILAQKNYFQGIFAFI